MQLSGAVPKISTKMKELGLKLDTILVNELILFITKKK